MYLTGAEMWVLPDEWVYTLESIEKRPESDKQDPADKLRVSSTCLLFCFLQLTSLSSVELDLVTIVWQIPSRGMYALRSRVPLCRNVGL